MTQSHKPTLAQGPISLEEIENPLIPQRADPWMYRHTDGYYYFTGSVPAYDRIELRRAETISGLSTAPTVDIWHKRDRGIMSMHIWAPEIHFIDGKWYIYYAAARTDAPFDHRMYVLENTASNPLEGTWEEKGQIKTAWESFSLDATTFEHNGTRYLVWAQRDPRVRGNSNLYIAAMSNPWTIIEPQVELTRPTYDWERIGFWVNEGAAVLKRNGRIFITYSGSATDSNYAMGLLTADEDSDLLDPESWTKAREPVFFTNARTGQYGPGHNSFTVSAEGDDLLVYHARNYTEIEGDPLYDPNRHARVQKLYWNEDGTPYFGIPVPDGPLPVRFRAASEEGAYLAHDGDRAILDANLTQIERSQFRVIPGLADADAYSLESTNQPGHYLRHRDGVIWLEADDGSESFMADATWQITRAEGRAEGIWIESYNMSGAGIVAQEGALVLGPLAEDGAGGGAFVVER
ncbi:MAG: family 43 glycosylhydrolase [Chloroflexi bacterium]|nr:family 43 glycosylhydrolase [Chloroflexota bacterium]